MAEDRIWRVRFEAEGHEPGLPVWVASEKDAQQARGAGYAVREFWDSGAVLDALREPLPRSGEPPVGHSAAADFLLRRLGGES